MIYLMVGGIALILICTACACDAVANDTIDETTEVIERTTTTEFIETVVLDDKADSVVVEEAEEIVVDEAPIIIRKIPSALEKSTDDVLRNEEI